MQKEINETPATEFAKAIDRISRVVSLSLRLQHKIDATDAEAINFLREKSGNNQLSIEQIRNEYSVWALEEGFVSLANILPQLLETARKNCSTSASQKEIREFDRKPFEGKLSFLEDNYGLRCERHKEAIISFNKARNCLVHRKGIVSERDTNTNDHKYLQISWLGVDFFVDDGQTKEKKEIPFEIKKGAKLSGVNVKRTKSFKIGDQIVFNSNEFREITFTMNFFVAELSENLAILKATIN